jgi:soluble lytic murein transglycosylase-like protein
MSSRLSRLPLASLLLLLPAQALGDIYTYIDRRGVVHYANIDRPSRKWRRVMATGPGKAKAVHARRSAARRKSRQRYTRYDDHIRQAAALYQIPEALVRAVIRIESDYDPEAISQVGAEGLMQLMPATARGMGVENSFDPRQNIFGGTRYLRILANRFAGDLVRTLASYHAGPMAVIKYRGVPPYRTTQRYVRLVLRRYKYYRERESS